MRRVVLVAFLLIATAIGTGFAVRHYLTAPSFQFVPERVPRLVSKPLEVVPGVYLLGGLSPSAAYVVQTRDGLVLVDSGLDPDAKQLKAQLASLSLDPQKIIAILLTHAHGDHCGGADALRRTSHAKVYAGAGDAPVLTAGQPREAFFSTFHMPNHSPHPTTVDVALKGGETLDFGDTRVRAIGTPGHTPGSICYLVEREGLRMLFAGDVIMMLQGDAQPRNELGKPLGTYSAYLSPRYRGDAVKTLTSLEALRALPVPDLVFPGHPGADVVQQSPCLTQERWNALLDKGIHDMQTLIARYNADGADFLDGAPKRLLPELFYFGEFHGSAVYGFIASEKFYVVDAPGGPGLAEFLNAQFARLGLDPKPVSAVFLTSCDPAATAGLRELIEKYHAQVITSPEAISHLEKTCPSGTVFFSTEQLSSKGSLPVRTFVLKGRGLFPMAYEVEISGKKALFSGMIPTKLNQAAADRLIADLTSPPGNAAEFQDSLVELRLATPDLWLPSIPVDDQNANIYDLEWDNVRRDNVEVAHLVESRTQRN